MTAPGHDPAAVGADIESLIQKVDALDPPARIHAQELVRLLMSLYGAGLARILDTVRTERGGPPAVLDRLASDPLIASLLVLHDLHPHPVETRVQKAVEALQPHLPGGTRLTLVAAGGDSAHVRVERTGTGGASNPGIRVAIERAIQEAAPEIGAVRIDGLADGAERLIQIVRREA